MTVTRKEHTKIMTKKTVGS